ncbi:MAG TPA: GH25 family lysozyme [Ruminococcus sp.]|nr:GH25 family lysozyme [Ruminococcus sp.]
MTTTTTMPMGVYIDQTYGTEVNWAAVKADGASYAVVSAGSGSEGADENFAANVNGAHSAGLGAAAIWHATSSTVDGIKAEAADFESVISGYKFEYPICLDLTDSAITGAGLTATQYEELVSAFCSYFEGKKYFISIRCDLSFINSSLNTSLFDKYDVWVRSYSNTKPNIGKTYGIWNYSSGTVNGVTGNVDKFYAYKNYPNIMSYNHLNGF